MVASGKSDGTSAVVRSPIRNMVKAFSQQDVMEEIIQPSGLLLSFLALDDSSS